MKTTISRMVFAIGLAALLATPAGALPSLTIDRVPGHFQSGFEGGEFTAFGTPFLTHYDMDARAQSASGAWGFQTFCLERNEYINLPGTYNYTVTSSANAGGVGGGSPDPLSIGTAWLYNQFASGVLAGYQYDETAASPTRAAHAKLLQNAIWWLEDELTLTVSQINANMFIGAVLGQFSSAAIAKGDAVAGAYGIYVLNLTQNGSRKQDQLVKIPDGGLTVALLGLALLGLGAARRRTQE